MKVGFYGKSDIVVYVVEYMLNTKYLLQQVVFKEVQLGKRVINADITKQS